ILIQTGLQIKFTDVKPKMRKMAGQNGFTINVSKRGRGIISRCIDRSLPKLIYDPKLKTCSGDRSIVLDPKFHFERLSELMDPICIRSYNFNLADMWTRRRLILRTGVSSRLIILEIRRYCILGRTVSDDATGIK